MALRENLRAGPNENQFKEWLMEVGDGRSRIYDGNNLVRLPSDVICVGNIVDEVFGVGELNMDANNRLNNAILCPTNADSMEINEVVLERLPSENREYLGILLKNWRFDDDTFNDDTLDDDTLDDDTLDDDTLDDGTLDDDTLMLVL
ncbi:atp-dependent dna helicase pif1 [Brachionus plicatilis]|uniref:Atp-dependent dna helicase pif1 n=1 Tax=Brachionus plicatilis TaxID=10195 RepID=A0A3M7QRW7_BRAPC|nr:atp-dependent dna helicase pif1 [Brachionus plicatilis]